MIQAEYRPFVRAVYRLYVNGLFSICDRLWENLTFRAEFGIEL